jgi:hypothetical protein
VSWSSYTTRADLTRFRPPYHLSPRGGGGRKRGSSGGEVRTTALPMGASAVQSRGMTSRGSRIRHRQRRRKKANIRANKPAPECRTPSHAVAHEPLEGSLDEPKCDGAGQSDTSSDTMELPTDQKVGDSSSSERAEQGG